MTTRGAATVLVSTVLGASIAVLAGEPLGGVWSSPSLAFWFVTLAAGLCLPLAAAVVVVGWRQATAELAILGSALTVVSAWSLAHGLATPGYLYDDAGASGLAARLALPAGLAVAAPALLSVNAPARWLIGRWRQWCLAMLAGNTLGVVSVLAERSWTGGLDAMVTTSVATIAIAAGTVLLARRHLRLYRIGRRRASAVAAASMLYLGIASVIALHSPPTSAAAWIARAVDAAALVTAAVGALVAYRADTDIASIVAPVVNADPLVAMELGLSPEIHAFVSALERKDATTRHHVVRVGELAMRVGIRAGLAPSRLRAVGLAALLHDIGKIVIPSAIIGKPSQLTDAEFAVMKTHSEQGAALLEQSVTLRSVAPLVRAHHERPDGSGYPDHLVGDDLTVEMAIVSVCDAWDAMTNDRQYRAGMTHQHAAELLEAGAGTQWRSDVVALLLAEVRASAAVGTFERVGHHEGGVAGPPLDRAAGICPDAISVLAR